MTIYILEAEHVTVPGVRRSAHRTAKDRRKARRKPRIEFSREVSFLEFEVELK